jgi:hypothetical protein
MTARRLLAACLSALLLAVPAPVFAQSAGDDQYQDPLPSEPSSGGSDSTPGGGGSSTPSGGGDTAPSTQTPAPSAGDASAGSPSTSPAGSSGELPRTGGDPLILALFGGALLLTGAGMRLLVLPRRG